MDNNNLSDRVFSGKNNSIILVQKITIRSTCQYRLSLYPFDQQKCSLIFSIPESDIRYQLVQVFFVEAVFKTEF